MCRWLPVLAPISGLEFLRQLQIPQDFLIITELSEGNKLLPRGCGGRLATKNKLGHKCQYKYTILELYKKRSYPMAKDRMQRLGHCIWQLDGVHKLSSKVTTPSWFASSFHNVPMCLKSNMNSFVARALKDQRSETQQVSEVPWQTGIHWHLLDSSSIYWLHFVYRNNTEQHTDKPVKPMGICPASGVARRCSALNVSTGSSEVRDLLCLAVSMSTEPPHECRPVAK